MNGFWIMIGLALAGGFIGSAIENGFKLFCETIKQIARNK